MWFWKSYRLIGRAGTSFEIVQLTRNSWCCNTMQERGSHWVNLSQSRHLKNWFSFLKLNSTSNFSDLANSGTVYERGLLLFTRVLSCVVYNPPGKSLIGNKKSSFRVHLNTSGKIWKRKWHPNWSCFIRSRCCPVADLPPQQADPGGFGHGAALRRHIQDSLHWQKFRHQYGCKVLHQFRGGDIFEQRRL